MTDLHDQLSGRDDTEPTHSSSIDSIRDRLRGRTTLLIAALATSIAVGGVLLSRDPSQTGGSDDPEKFGDPNPYITSLSIDAGARIRSDPFVAEDGGGHTNLLTTTDELITLKIIHGVDEVFVAHDSSGSEWDGITASSLPPELDDLDKDKDGIVWINEQKASVTYENK